VKPSSISLSDDNEVTTNVNVTSFYHSLVNKDEYITVKPKSQSNETVVFSWLKMLSKTASNVNG